jgi:hypothetical protein
MHKQGSQPARDPDSLNDLDTWKAPSTPSAMRARNGSQRVQPPSDPVPRSQNLLTGQALPIRSLSNSMRHQAALFIPAVSCDWMVGRGWLIQALAGRSGASGRRPRNRSGRAA